MSAPTPTRIRYGFNRYHLNLNALRRKSRFVICHSVIMGVLAGLNGDTMVDLYRGNMAVPKAPRTARRRRRQRATPGDRVEALPLEI